MAFDGEVVRGPERESEAPRIVTGVGLLVLTVGALDLVGWWRHIPVLTSVIPHYATMKPNTAICLGLIALGLLSSRGPQEGRRVWLRVFSAGFGGLALVLGLVSLMEYVTGKNLGIDQMAFAVSPDGFLDPAGRMSVGTSVSVAVTSSALLLRNVRWRWSAGLTLLGLIVSISAILGFLFRTGPLVGVPWLRSLAIHTALALLVLQVGILASRPLREPFHSLAMYWRDTGRRRYLLFAVTILPVLLSLPVLWGLRAGVYDASFALGFLLVLLLMLQTSLLWTDNRSLGEAEGRLRKSEMRSTRILQSIGDAVIVTDVAGRLTGMNAVAEELTGWSLGEANRRPLAEVFAVFHESPVDKRYTMLAEVGEKAVVMLLRRDGGWTHVEAGSAPIREEDGRVAGTVLVFRDIGQRMAAERAIKAGDERLQIALDAAELGSWELEVGSGRMTCSATCKANFGLAPEQALDYADLKALIHPEDVMAMESAVGTAIERGELYRMEYRCVWPDGSLHWVVASGRAFYDEEGTATRMVGVTLDVTERHRTALALIQSEKLAAVGRLASSIAHEINNPLESVTNLLYLARQHAIVPEAQEYLDMAERELRRMAVISSQTLRFYKQTTKPKEVDANEMVDNVVLMFQGKILNSRVQVDWRPRGELLVLCLDGEIRQVLSNLVGNAIDAMHLRGGRLRLRARAGREWRTGRTGVVFTVADTGGGISPEAVGRIFEAFFSTKGNLGTGLGLWISSEIVQRHEGTLRVRSSQDEGHRGTVFSLFLPFAASGDFDASKRLTGVALSS